MIKNDREGRILNILDEAGMTSIGELSRRIGGVSEVTVRRDVVRLAERGLVIRTHGGVARKKQTKAVSAHEGMEGFSQDVDAIVLPPLVGRGAETLRKMAQRRGIPFLAESAPQSGGAYIGPDNFAAGRDLGAAAAAKLKGQVAKARILIVSHDALANTRERCEGFRSGFEGAFAGSVEVWQVDGRGVFKSALRASMDAFQAHPDINILFGVNDHSILAALEACDRLKIDNVAAFSIGGEGSALFDALLADDRMVACCALFPELVGVRSIDILEEALDGGSMPGEVITHHAVITPDNLAEYYRHTEQGWSLNPAQLDAATKANPQRKTAGNTARIGFIPHYPTHDWYRNMRRAMQQRAIERGMELVVAEPQAGIAQEINALRRDIARSAAATVSSGETILINHGAMALRFAEALDRQLDLTVVTNSLDVLERLTGRGGLKVILTSGELHGKERCLVGPSLGALFETMRVDRAFLSVDGVSARFGLSSNDERLALAARRFADASRVVTVLADHSLLGHDANHRIVPADKVTELITDSGSVPADRLALASAGIAIALADEDMPETRKPPSRRPIGGANQEDRPQATL